MNEKDFDRLIKLIEAETIPPEGLKDEIYKKIQLQSGNNDAVPMTKVERFIFEKPLRFACAFSLVISFVLWAVMGSNFTKFLLS